MQTDLIARTLGRAEEMKTRAVSISTLSQAARIRLDVSDLCDLVRALLAKDESFEEFKEALRKFVGDGK